MNIKHIKISNILGIEELEITPGKFNEIRGRNGTGKTSVLEAIKSAVKGGHDATLLRNGATEGEVVLVFDNDDEVRRTVKADKSEVKVRRDGKRVIAAASVLDQIRDLVACNPVEFIHASPKRRLEILLEAMSFDITDEELSEAAGFPCRVEGNPLDCVGSIRKAIYDERTGLSRAEREKRATVNQLVETIPTDIVEDPELELSSITRQLRAQGDIRQEKLDAIEKERQFAIDRANAEAAHQRELVQANHEAIVAPMNERFAALSEQAKAKGRIEQQKAIIEQMDGEIVQLTEQVSAKTEALGRLDALKSKLLANMPFKGLTIQDGEIYLDGVAFDRVNSSDQVRFVLQLAAHRMGELRMVCVDGLELIDPERYTRFVEAAKKLDMQFFVTRVTADEFTIESVG